MSPSFLVVGATGNTGRGVVETLSKLLQAPNNSFSNYRILALSRNSQSDAAQKLATLPNVEVLEQNWVEITAEWLREHEVARAFMACHTQPNAFIEESTFHLAALRAGVEYVVRISTAAANVRPDCDAYYPRTHWAIETMLATPAFENLAWTSLQPNIFTPLLLSPAAELIKKVRAGGKQDTLRLMPSATSPIGAVDPLEVGALAAHLLVQVDTSVYNKAKLVVNGPEDITGEQIVAMVEKHIGAKVQDVEFKDVSFIDHMAAASPESKNVILSTKNALKTGWEGLCRAETTSPEVLKLAAPKTTPAQILDSML